MMLYPTVIKEEKMDNDKGCVNCYYQAFHECAYPCSVCIRGKTREDMWRPALSQQKMQSIEGIFDSKNAKHGLQIVEKEANDELV